MKSLSLILNGVLIIAVVILYILHFSSPKSDKIVKEELSQTETIHKFAFINIDSLLQDYKFAQELNEKLQKQQKDARKNLNKKLKKFQDDVQLFQAKIQNNGFLTQASAKKEGEKLAGEEQRLQRLEMELTNNLTKENLKMNTQLRDSLSKYLKIYNIQHPFDLVFSNTLGDNILYNKNELDITKEIATLLNEPFSKQE